MLSAIRCPRCGASREGLSPDAPCMACLMRLGLGNSPDKQATAEAPTREGSEDPPGRWVAPSAAQLAPLFPELDVHRLLGQGGMGAVYLARQKSLDRLVALKIIRPEPAGEASFAERFAREARMMARLNHPNIVAVYDFGERDGLYFLLMEYVEGVNLRQLMTQQPLAPSQALAIVPPICEALQYAHEEGVVHRDIKPENILVDRRGRVRLADFGLAKLARNGHSGGTLTESQQVMGTPRYMAPEQLLGSRDVDHRADIYSLGVVFYELLTGDLPIGRFDPPSQHAGIDARLDQVVLRTLERDPQRRYQQAVEVKTDIESIGTAKRPESLLTPPPVVEQRLEPIHRPAASGGERPWAPAIAMTFMGGLQSITSVLFAGILLQRLAGPSQLTFAAMMLVALVVIPAVLLGALAVIGGVALLRGRALELSRAAAIGLLLPVSPVWLLAATIGAWVLLTLARGPHGASDDAYRPAPPDPLAGRPIVGPAVALTTAGGLQLVVSIFLTFIGLMRVAGSSSLPILGLMFTGLLLVAAALLGALAVAGGILLLQRKWSGFVRLAACGLLLPFSPAWLLAAPLAIWVLVYLARDAKVVAVKPGKKDFYSVPRPRYKALVLLAAGLLLLAAGLYYLSQIQGPRLLPKAAQRGNRQQVSWLLALGTPVDARDAEGMTPLMWAAWEGHAGPIEQLLRAGAFPNAETPRGETALMKAAHRGHERIVARLADAGADVNATDRDGQTALLRAAAGGHWEVVERLMTLGAQVDAAEHGGWTPLVAASAAGHADIASLLIRSGAGVHRKARDGKTALIVAAAAGQTDVVAVLLAAGAMIDEQSRHGETALLRAAYGGHASVVQRLLQGRANPKLANYDGTTPLVAAAMEGHTGILKLLLEAGADPNSETNDGLTALGAAVRQGHAAAVEILLAAGAKEEGCLWLWRGYQRARQGDYEEAEALLQLAAEAFFQARSPCQFRIQDWSYEVPSAALFARLAIFELRRKAKKPDVDEAWRSAQALLPTEESQVTVLRRIHTTRTKRTQLDYQISPAALQQAAADPTIPLSIQTFMHEEENLPGRHSVRTGFPHASSSSLFE